MLLYPPLDHLMYSKQRGITSTSEYLQYFTKWLCVASSFPELWQESYRKKRLRKVRDAWSFKLKLQIHAKFACLSSRFTSLGVSLRIPRAMSFILYMPSAMTSYHSQEEKTAPPGPNIQSSQPICLGFTTEALVEWRPLPVTDRCW